MSLNRTGRLWAARFLFCLLPGLAGAQAPAQPEAASGYAPRPAVAAARHIAATPHASATDAALAVLREGGSAVDAALAAQFVLNLVEPQSSGIGGGGFMLHWDAASRRVAAYDGRETAPRAASPERFSGAGFREVVATWKSVGTPGLVAMLALAHRQHGRLPWARLLEPAIRLAEDGFAVSPRLHLLLTIDPHLRDDPAARALYYRADGRPYASGSILRNPAFAQTLRVLAVAGAETFYRGTLAVELVAAVSAAGGDLGLDDMAAYRARIREPVCSPYRQWRVCGMPPPSSGGIAVAQILGILERLPFAAAAPLSADAVHYFAEAGRLAFADRRRYLGDPDFVAVPQRELLSPDYLTARARRIDAVVSRGEAPPGDLAERQALADDTAPELPATQHLSIVDGEGNAVALTSSIEDAFGSRRMVGGYLLNNELTDFAFAPTDRGRPVANRVQGGKRPLSSMAPTLVFDADGGLHAVVGSPGGPRIIGYVAKTLVALLDWKLPPAAALALPHFGSRNGPTELERGSFAADMQLRLEARGHAVVIGDMTSGLQIVVRDGQRWLGAADPRREGTVAGD